MPAVPAGSAGLAPRRLRVLEVPRERGARRRQRPYRDLDGAAVHALVLGRVRGSQSLSVDQAVGKADGPELGHAEDSSVDGPVAVAHIGSTGTRARPGALLRDLRGRVRHRDRGKDRRLAAVGSKGPTPPFRSSAQTGCRARDRHRYAVSGRAGSQVPRTGIRVPEGGRPGAQIGGRTCPAPCACACLARK